MKPTNSPTQGQPNPRKIRLKVAFGPLFPTAKYFFVDWDWCYIGKTGYRKPNRTKITANTLFKASVGPIPP